MEHNGYQQYQEQAIFSMTQNELLLLLLNELIKRLGRCDLALTQKNYALLDESADRCLAIVPYLDLRDTFQQAAKNCEQSERGNPQLPQAPNAQERNAYAER